MTREQEFFDRVRASFRAPDAWDDAWVEWVAGRVEGEAVTVLYRWVSRRTGPHPVDGRRWVLDGSGREVFNDPDRSLGDLVAEAVLEIQEPEGPGTHLDVPWADGLVPEPEAVQWHGSAVELH